MQSFLLEHYLTLKALHIIAVVAWMAAMLYLPRLYVYHADVAPDSDMARIFKTMERRLLRAIMNPAMMASFLFGGLMLAANPALMSQGWVHGKLAAVAGLVVLHILFSRWRRDFEQGRNQRTARFYRIWNEAPTVLMIAIVFLAVLKPF